MCSPSKTSSGGLRAPRTVNSTRIVSISTSSGNAPDGRKVKFKPYNRLPFSLFRQARTVSELESIFAFIEYAVPEKDQKVLDDCTIEQINDAIAAWQADAGVSPGE
jgi:hypothetical protein